MPTNSRLPERTKVKLTKSQGKQTTFIDNRGKIHEAIAVTTQKVKTIVAPSTETGTKFKIFMLKVKKIGLYVLKVVAWLVDAVTFLISLALTIWGAKYPQFNRIGQQIYTWLKEIDAFIEALEKKLPQNK